jgi:hypothetical protein
MEKRSAVKVEPIIAMVKMTSVATSHAINGPKTEGKPSKRGEKLRFP